MFSIAQSSRIRNSPFHDAIVEEGVVSFIPYNQMLLPIGFGDPDGEYDRLINGVSQWDVAAERQIQLKGPDAAALAQALCPRDLTKCKMGQGKYVAVCDHAGTILNDPILLKRDEETYWLSIADSNIEFWASAIAAERRMNVDVSEPDVSPMAVQGPKADDVVAAVFGDWVRDLKYFWFHETMVDGIPVAVARSGWSKQGGFEIYLMDGTKGTALWNIVREAGQPFGIGPGNPNLCERIESGLLSWGGDTDKQTNPFEVRMEKYVDLDVPDDVVGIQALRQIKQEGPKRHQLGVILDGEYPLGQNFLKWHTIAADGAQVGHMTNGVWSRRLEKTIGFALVSTACNPGDRVTVLKEDAKIDATLTTLPFL